MSCTAANLERTTLHGVIGTSDQEPVIPFKKEYSDYEITPVIKATPFLIKHADYN
jgi:hypothetical protein